MAGYTCTYNICNSFGDIERIDDKTVKCMDHGTLFEIPVDSITPLIAETPSKTFIEDHGDQL